MFTRLFARRLLCLTSYAAFAHAALGQSSGQAQACTLTSSNDVPYEAYVDDDLDYLDQHTEALPHGSLLRCFSLTPSWSSWYTGLSYLDRATITRHVVSDAAGNKALGSAAVFTSSKASNDQGGSERPVVVLNTATVGIPAHCGASTQLMHSTNLTIKDDVQRYLKKGYTVVVPDYFGHGVEGQSIVHPYLEGPSLGRSVLDAVRAARALPSSPVSGNKLMMEGFSQGGQATLWAQHLAASYTPEIQFDVIRAGGATVDMDDTVGRVANSYYNGGYTTDTRAFAAVFVGMTESTVAGVGMSESEILSFTSSSEARTRVAALMQQARESCRSVIGISVALSGGMKQGDFDVNAFRVSAKYLSWAAANSLAFKVAGTPGQWTTSMSKPSVNTKVTYYGATHDEMVPPAALRDITTRLWAPPFLSSNGVKPSLTNLFGQLSIDRNAQSTWLDLDPDTSHAVGDAALYDDDGASYRYTPGEWLADALFSYSRAVPDAAIDSSN